MLKKIRQHLPYTGDYPNVIKPANIDNSHNQLTPSILILYIT